MLLQFPKTRRQTHQICQGTRWNLSRQYETDVYECVGLCYHMYSLCYRLFLTLCLPLKAIQGYENFAVCTGGGGGGGGGGAGGGGAGNKGGVKFFIKEVIEWGGGVERGSGWIFGGGGGGGRP